MRQCKDMPYHSGIVLRIYPNFEQQHIISQNAGCRRFVYNRLVALNNERYRLSRSAGSCPADLARLSYIDSILNNPSVALPAALKNSAPFLYGKYVDSLVIDNAIKNYRAAWKKFREDPKAGVPQFHKKEYELSYQTNAHYKPDATDINGGNVRFEDKTHMQLPILGRIRISGSKKRIAGLMCRKQTRIGTITVSMDAVGRYFVSLQMASEFPFVEKLPAAGSAVGIDLNVDNFLWDSNDNKVDNPKYRRNEKTRLSRLQRRASRRLVRAKKDGKPLSEARNYQRARKAVALLHSRIANRGDDFRHVISKRYIENQDYLFVEDLKVRNLLKNHKLALAISECGWSDFLAKLDYKAGLYGRVLMRVPAPGTTQTCSQCGYVLTGKDKLTLGDREWVCPVCGAYHVRDYNAAKNILARGLAASGLTGA